MQLSEANNIYSSLQKGNFDDLSQIALTEAIRLLVDSWRKNLIKVSMNGVMGAPDWLGYELKIWKMGEVLRHLYRFRRWKGKDVLLDQVANLIKNRDYGKGRQTLALLLGDFGGKYYSDDLIELLDDRDICGHVIKAIKKARIRGMSEKVRHIAENSGGWVKRAAQNYIKDEEKRSKGE